MPEIEPLWHRNRNQRVHTGGLMRGAGGGGLIRGVTQVLRRRWSYLRVPIRGGLISGEIRYIK